MKAVIAGPDRGLGAALREEGVDVVRVEEIPGTAALDEAGIADADLFVLTDVEEATAVSVARNVNPDVRVVVYSPDTMPEFVRSQVDFAIAPGVMDATVVAEELVAAGEQ